MESDWTFLEYSVEDFAMARAWCEAHGRIVVRPEWLPETGFIICQGNEPVVMFWLYFDPSCVVGFVDWFITKPRTPIPVTKAAYVYALREPIRRAMRLHNATLVVSRSPLAMARHITKMDRWEVDTREIVSLSYFYTPEELAA